MLATTRARSDSSINFKYIIFMKFHENWIRESNGITQKVPNEQLYRWEDTKCEIPLVEYYPALVKSRAKI